MKKLLVILSLAILTLTCVSQNKVEKIEVELFKSMIESANIILVDIRTPQEFESGYIAGAININFYSPDFYDRMAELDKQKSLFIYCRSGNRSGQASSKLLELGFPQLFDLKGGINSWNSIDAPLIKK